MLKILKNFRKIKTKNKNNEKGVALVIAITTVTLLLSISLSISNIVLRQIKITNINNESKPAFYIADSAIECAFYWDTTFMDDGYGDDLNANFSTSIFGTTTDSYSKDKIKCSDTADGKILAFTQNANTDSSIINTNFDIDYGDNKCAKVEVIKTEVNTKITARGYNTGVDANGCDLSNIDKRRLVERGLTIMY